MNKFITYIIIISFLYSNCVYAVPVSTLKNTLAPQGFDAAGDGPVISDIAWNKENGLLNLQQIQDIVRDYFMRILTNAGVSTEVLDNKSIRELFLLIPQEYMDTHGGNVLNSYLKGLLDFAEEKAGNIASGTWHEAQHDVLNQKIAELIGTENDLSGRYNQEELNGELKKILPNISHQIRDRLLSLLDNPRLRFFFLKPRYGEDKFSFVDANGNVLHAVGHFGHNKIKGINREENCYFSSPWFDSCTMGERLGLIVHETVHLVLGKGDDVHKLAEEVQHEVRRQYDNQYVQGVALHIAQYIKLKDDLFTAVLEERREDALHIYNEWKATIANARGVALHIGVDTLAEIIFSGLKDRIGPVLAEILANLQFAGSDVNIKGIIISQLLEKAGIRGALGRLIYDTINSLHIRGIPTQEDLINGFLSISYSLAQEIKILSQDKFLVTIFGWLRLNFLTLSGN